MLTTPRPLLDLRAAEAARAARHREHILSHALDTRPQAKLRQQHESVPVAKPRRQWHFRHPQLVVHPLTIGLVAGVVGAFGIAFATPRINVANPTLPTLAAPVSAANVAPAPAHLASAPAPGLAAKPVDRLSIPALGINAPLTTVGLINGALDTPKTLWQVGHYSASAMAGSIGTNIIVGHSGAPGQVGVFEHLNRLKAGDVINYRYVDGRSFAYTVLTSAAYPVTSDTALLLFRQTANPTINLVTCYGQWNASSKDYDQRWIITAQLAQD